jgi:hypothetical protein
MNIETFIGKFKRFAESDIPVVFGDWDDQHPVSDKPLKTDASRMRVEIFEGDVESSFLNAKQLFEHVKSLKGCDKFELFFMPAGGGEWPVQLVSPRPNNGIVFLDLEKTISG